MGSIRNDVILAKTGKEILLDKNDIASWKIEEGDMVACVVKMNNQSKPQGLPVEIKLKADGSFPKIEGIIRKVDWTGGMAYIKNDFFYKITHKEVQVEKLIVSKLFLETGDKVLYHCGINKFGKPQATALEVKERASGWAITEDVIQAQ